MAITKVISKPAKTHAGLRNVLEYVLRDDKVKEGYMDILGPSPNEITWDSVYNAFVDEKKLWGKDNGRMCAHYVLSFHKDEDVTPEQVLEIARELAEKMFAGHQVLITVHQDKGHLHAHIVVNTVSYLDGKKLQSGPEDLQALKDLTNDLCKERGLSVAEKGKHFDGSEIMTGDVISWNKNTYNLLNNQDKPSYLVDCAFAVQDSIAESESQEAFIKAMESRGWSVTWSDKREHITFKDQEGHKVRDTKLSKTFSLDITKESLLDEFERKAEANRGIERELDQYDRQAEDAGNSAETVTDNKRSASNDSRKELDNSAAERRAIEAAEAQSRAAEQQRRSEESKRHRRKRRARQGYGHGE